MTITAEAQSPTRPALAGAAWPLPGITRAQAQQMFDALAAALGQDGREGPADQPAHSVPATAAPASAAAGGVSVSSGEAAVDLEASALAERVRPAGPVVSILGPLRVVGATGDAPVARSTGTVSAAQTQRCAALAAFLALHPGASAEAYTAAFWPGARADGPAAAASRNKLSGQLRRYLGQDAHGRPFFPVVRPDGYRLHPAVTTDWTLFGELVGPSPVTASDAALVAALRMVRGAPFEHARPRNVAWADDLHREMVEAITAAARELAGRASRSGHVGHGQLATRVGRMVDPGDEGLWRASLEAEAAAGAREEVARLVEGLHAYLEAMEASPEVETVEVIARLREQGYRMPGGIDPGPGPGAP
ncbi:hypothetical protein NJC10_11140 [Micrococcus sp. M4NT]|uniref:hypothetical protein n=1 Tax=Micrococcus sp. M4NT TaxID=2957501 RepID=UPI0029AA1D1A|nr:hypothetical protein [Micrococcus sp. M4NT]MDX2342196.1 hypothetical protein [Micrococcus sp. M4NT]